MTRSLHDRRTTAALTLALATAALAILLAFASHALAQRSRGSCVSAAVTSTGTAHACATTARHRPARAHGKSRRRHSRHGTSRRNASKRSHRPHASAPSLVPALCEDGSEARPGDEAVLLCEDGSEPICEDSSTPTPFSGGATDVCLASTDASGEETCPEEGPATGEDEGGACAQAPEPSCPESPRAPTAAGEGGICVPFEV
jgi:hypothetical protein